MKDITNVDYRHAKRVFKNFNNKRLDGYHDLYVQSDTLLLEDIFEHFRSKCIEIYVYCWLKKELQEEYVMQYIGIQKQTISI